MLLWHLGIAALIVYVTLGRRRIDYRMVLIGALLPDLVDGVLGFVWFEGAAGRWIAHSIFAAIGVAIVILLTFSGELRQSLFGIGVGWLLHLVADGMCWPRSPSYGLRSGPSSPRRRANPTRGNSSPILCPICRRGAANSSASRFWPGSGSPSG
ncbi:MAG: metal-dependent hydrolase [Actinomycetota bacterium]|nr:metal-dependent hydrolase [Actinomycetota bacterium]